jgi:hypothetical protein
VLADDVVVSVVNDESAEMPNFEASHDEYEGNELDLDLSSTIESDFGFALSEEVLDTSELLDPFESVVMASEKFGPPDLFPITVSSLGPMDKSALGLDFIASSAIKLSFFLPASSENLLSCRLTAYD